jgi:pyruvate dehydrogenase E1 component alpha subunit
MGHFEGDEQTYRTKQDIEEWKTKDPILRLKDIMVREGALTDKEFDELNESILKEIDDAVAFAEKSEWPESSDALEDVYTSI